MPGERPTGDETPAGTGKTTTDSATTDVNTPDTTTTDTATLDGTTTDTAADPHTNPIQR